MSRARRALTAMVGVLALVVSLLTAGVIDAPGAIAGSGQAAGGAFTLTKTATSSNPAFLATPATPKTLPTGGGTVTYSYTVTNTSGTRLYYSSKTDDKCTNWSGPSPALSVEQRFFFGFEVARYSYIPVGGSATWTCTQYVSQKTTNTATFRFGTGIGGDAFFGYDLTGVVGATATELVDVAYDPWAACSVPTIWGNSGAWGGTAVLYEYRINADGSVTPTGKSITASGATGADIAISPDGTRMYVTNGAGVVREYNVATGTLIRTITVTFPDGVVWGTIAGDNKDKINSLSFGPNGNLYMGGFNYNTAISGITSGSNSLYSVAIPTGTTNVTVGATIVWNGGTAEGVGVVPYGYAGDFVTLPDGSLLALVIVDNGGGKDKFVIFPKLADGSLGAPVNAGYPTFGGTQMAQVFGMTYADGYLWLAKDDGSWYRSSVLPTIGGTTLPMAQVTEPSVAVFWGATGSQESNTSCTSSYVSVTKTAGAVSGPTNGIYTANYTITVRNTGTRTGTYGPLTDMPQFDPVFRPTGATWTATGVATPTPSSQSGTGPYLLTKQGTSIAPGSTHTYNVAVTFTWDKTALPAACTTSPGTGLFNTITTNPNVTSSGCSNPQLPWVNIAKTAGTVTGPDANGVYSVTHTVTVKNTGTAATTYGALTDQPAFDSDLTVLGASWTGQTTGSGTGTGPFTLAPANTAIAAGATHTYTVTTTFTKSGTGPVAACSGTAGSGLYNSVALPTGQENGPIADNSACVEAPNFVAIHIEKSVALSTTTTPPIPTAKELTVKAGQSVTYYYQVTVPAGMTEPLKNVTVSDDKLGAISPVLSNGFNVGDLDQDNILDLSETWLYTSAPTTMAVTNDTNVVNIATATGIGTISNTTVTDTDTNVVHVVVPQFNVQKKGVSVTGPAAGTGYYTATYTVTVKNIGTPTDNYGAITDTLSFDPSIVPVSASWSGPTSGSTSFTQAPYTFQMQPNPNPIASGVTDTYTVSVVFDYAGAPAASACNGPGTGLYNQVSLPAKQEPTSNQGDNADCLQPPASFKVNKSAAGGAPGSTGTPVTVAPDGTVSITYTVTVTNSGNVAGSHLAITDQLTLPVGFALTAVTVGGVAQTTSNGAFTLPASTSTLAPGASVQYVITVTGKASDWTTVDWTKANTCTTDGAGTPGNGGFFNVVTMTKDTDGATNNDACVQVVRPTTVIHLNKTAENCDVGIAMCPLLGAEFVIYAQDPTTAGAAALPNGVVADATGGATFTSVPLAYPGTYWLIETKAPAEFELLAAPIRFTLTAQGAMVLSEPNPNVTVLPTASPTVQIVNLPAAGLPEAGGRGPLPYAVFGLLLLLTAAVLHRGRGPRTPGRHAVA